MDTKSLRNIETTNKHTAKLHHVGSLYILTYDARKLKHKKTLLTVILFDEVECSEIRR